ncbi:MAG: DUF2271 domain-containing protein [Salinivirgaceae bacterium]|jgi:hypothetical protein
MKNLLLITILLITTIITIHAQSTDGTLTVSTTTSSTGGNYAPKHIVAIWIETESGNFVKTLLAYGEKRKTHLNTWELSTTNTGSAFNKVDAITGATQSNHGKKSCTWNGTNVSGTIVADGNYVLWMELTDKNATGNFSSFTFTKGLQPITLTPANKPSFSSIAIDWVPKTTGVSENAESGFIVYPNPTTGLLTIQGNSLKYVELYSMNGVLVHSGKEATLDISNQLAGIYMLLLYSSEGEPIIQKIVKE